MLKRKNNLKIFEGFTRQNFLPTQIWDKFGAGEKKNLGGFTLLEVMATVFVVTVGLVGVFNVITNLGISASISSDRLIASYLAQEGIEIIRNIRDGNLLEQIKDQTNPWDEGLMGCSFGCEVDYTISTEEDPILQSYQSRFFKINSNGFYNYTIGSDTKFKRKITITQESADALRVEVLVDWQTRGKSYQFSALEKIYNWH